MELNDIKPEQQITEDEQMECFKIMDIGKKENASAEQRAAAQKARNRVIEGSMSLALWVVKNNPIISALPMPITDKIGNAYLGLIYAVDHFDLSYGAKLSTYAVKCIEGTILNEFGKEKASAWGINCSAIGKMFEILRIENNYYQTVGKKPTDEQIATIIYGDCPSAERIKRIKSKREFIYSRINMESFYNVGESEFHGDDIVDNAADADAIEETPSGYVLDGVYFEESIPDYVEEIVTENVPEYGVEDRARINISREIFEQSLDSVLTQKEAYVIRALYYKGKTIEDVTRDLGIVYIRARQILARALRKLKDHYRAQRFSGPGGDVTIYPIRRKRIIASAPYDDSQEGAIMESTEEVSNKKETWQYGADLRRAIKNVTNIEEYKAILELLKSEQIPNTLKQTVTNISLKMDPFKNEDLDMII